MTCSRIVTGTADLLIAADEVVAVAKETITLAESSRTHGIINTHLIPIADFIMNRDFDFKRGKVNLVLENALHKDSAFLDFTKPAETLLGDSIATNMMMMGYAYQKGLLPVSAKAIEQAIELNAVSIKMNTQAFRLGRLAAHDPARWSMMKGDEPELPKTLDEMSLDEIIAHRTKLLTDYQDAQPMPRAIPIWSIRFAKSRFDGGYGEALPRAVAISYAKLLAYKDEYEVARLYSGADFAENIGKQFEGNYKISFNLAPPILHSGLDASGRPKKRVFGAWMMPVFRTMAKFRFLRGTMFDPFGYSEDRKLERNLIKGYEQDVVTAVKLLSPKTHDIAVELLSLPDQIRGYGPVKEASVAKAKTRYEQLAKDIVDPPPLAAPRIAAE